MGSRRIAAFVAAASLVILGAGSAPPASASTLAPIDHAGGKVTIAAVAPKVYFVWASARVNATAPISAKYTVVGAPAGATVVMQRTFGTARLFKTIAKLGRVGTFTGRAPARGVYTYRIVVRSSAGKVLAVTKKNLYSYGTVTFATAMQDQTATVQIGSQLFRYVTYGTNFGGTYTYLHFDRTSCRSGVIRAGKTGDAEGVSQIIQETADAQALAVAPGTVATQRFTLSGKAADFQIIDPGGDNGFLYVDGTLNCYTADGRLG